MKLKRVFCTLPLVLATFISSCACGKDSAASFKIFRIKADSVSKEIDEYRSISITKHLEEKEYEVNFIFSKKYIEANFKEYYYFFLEFSGITEFEVEGDNTDYSFVDYLIFLTQDREEIKKNEYNSIHNYLISKSCTIFINYSNVGEFGVSIFDNENFPDIEFAEITHHIDTTSGGRILLRSLNYSDEEF